MPTPPSGTSSSAETPVEAAPAVPGMVMGLYRHPVVRFLLVGGVSFALDLGLLAILHEIFDVPLWIATPIAFIVSLVFNFLLQRLFTFRANNSGSISALKYILLVIVNILVSDLIVTGFDAVGWTYVIGKTAATILTTAWNYFLYRHWIFRRTPEETRS
ncbi:GtrA family protein [Pseudarthrobacter sp. NIBRBAC000502770]|uniref:GtrA family protein n=1 Tax=Pseudarthrobacter sp. NIBRBAC000502770 TaxID=2590785 RepID=UPI001FED821D|nr:GtrA family protein [Pseudarthrobacter sp. NIBRBAC000502770]